MENEIKNEEQTAENKKVKVEEKPKKLSKKAIVGIVVGAAALAGATIAFVVTKGKTGNPVKAAEAAAAVATAAV